MGELSVLRGKRFNIERAVKFMSVFQPVEICVALPSTLQQLGSCSVSFQLLQLPGRISLHEDQATGRHLPTLSVPQTGKSSRGSGELQMCSSSVQS